MADIYLMFGEDVCDHYNNGGVLALDRISEGDFGYFHLLEYDDSTMDIFDVMACHDGYTASTEINSAEFEYLTKSEYAITYKKQ